MNIDITRLLSGIDKEIKINEEIHMNSEYAGDTDLVDLKNTSAVGKIYKNSLNEINLSLMITGTMILPCAITLNPIPYDFSTNLDCSLEDLIEENDKNQKKRENSIDILPIIWENILVEMPMRVVSEDLSSAKLSGDGWKFITEEERTYENPELAKLRDLLK